MLQHLARCLVTLGLGGWLYSADLPIVRIIIGPDGALVEHAGTLPLGDAVVSGLPLGINSEQLSVTIAGLTTPPALHVRLPTVAALPPPPAAWSARNRAAIRDFEAVQARIELASLRERLVAAVQTSANLFNHDETQAINPPFHTLAPPTPAAQQALLTFITNNSALAHSEREAALRDRERAREQLIILDEEREAARPQRQLFAELPLPGAEGKIVRLRYTVERARWAPHYCLEVNGAKAVLVREAIVDVPPDVTWRSGQLELVTRMNDTGLLLRELTVPMLGLGDELVQIGGVGRRRLLAKGGSSRTSESSIDHFLRQSPNTDGSWGNGAVRIHATSLRLLMYTGAGYDHKTPNKYRATIEKMVAWLTSQVNQCPDLSAQSLIVFALSDIQAMTNDEALKPFVQLAIDRLRERAFTRGELDVAIYRKGPMVGPEALAWTMMAFKNALGGGFDTSADIVRCRDMSGELIGHSDRAEAQITRLLMSVYLPGADRVIAPFPIDEWLDAAPQWIGDGKPELIYFASLALFQVGGNAYARWDEIVRRRLFDLLAAIARGQPVKNLIPHPYGDDVATGLITLPTMLYYRYRAVGRADVEPGKNERLLRTTLPNVAQAAMGWPLRYDAGKAQLTAGQLQRIHLDRVPLPGVVTLHATPIDNPGAWRVLTSTNPLTTPLIAGDIDVVVDNERLGNISMSMVPPGAPFSLPLGRDDRVQISRHITTNDTEAWGKRTRTTTIRYRIDAPKGLHPTLHLDEPMPRPADPVIQLVSSTPAIAITDLDRLLVEDPVWHLHVPINGGSATTEIIYDLRYPATVRPVIAVGPTTTTNDTATDIK